ncbi:lysozyme [Pontibacter sp. SGAir0037]|nr:lysozyme [Pontibacter sp. SGAir0037]
MFVALFTSVPQKLIFSGLLLYASITGASLEGTEKTNTTTSNNTAAISSTNNFITSSSLKGIDVSRWQKEVDWPLVKEAEVSFAFVKATQSDFRQDPYFYRNWEETKRVGIKRGAYHFFIPTAPIQGQIDNFKATVRLEPGDLPPVLDIEVAAANMSGEELRQNIRTWLEGITEHYGIKPIIYTNQTYYRRWLQGHFQEYHFWIARYNTAEPDVHHTDRWLFWQYSDRGNIPGISAAVDMNFFVGDWDTLHLMCLPEFVQANENPLMQFKHIQPLP